MNVELKPIAESKVRQLGGDVCGVLVCKDEQLAAVDEHGRVMWLDSWVEGQVEPAGVSERELFEQRFPVPAGIYWNDISEQYDALPSAAGFDDVEIYHGQWMGWQAARAQGGQAVEPTANREEAFNIACVFSSYSRDALAKKGMTAEKHNAWFQILKAALTNPQPAQLDPDLQLIRERDYWEGKATELAEDVGKLLGVEVGEHSSENCPVQNAIDAVFRATEYRAQQGSVPEIPSNEELERLYREKHDGHIADFAADVLERWGAWPHGVLGYGGSAQPAQQGSVPDSVIRQCEDAIQYASEIRGGCISGVREAQKRVRAILDTPQPAQQGSVPEFDYDHPTYCEIIERIAEATHRLLIAAGHDAETALDMDEALEANIYKNIDMVALELEGPQQGSVPEGWRLRILSEFPLLDDDGLDQEKHHCEWSMQQDRKRLHSILAGTPQPEGGHNNEH